MNGNGAPHTCTQEHRHDSYAAQSGSPRPPGPPPLPLGLHPPPPPPPPVLRSDTGGCEWVPAPGTALQQSQQLTSQLSAQSRHVKGWRAARRTSVSMQVPHTGPARQQGAPSESARALDTCEPLAWVMQPMVSTCSQCSPFGVQAPAGNHAWGTTHLCTRASTAARYRTLSQHWTQRPACPAGMSVCQRRCSHSRLEPCSRGTDRTPGGWLRFRWRTCGQMPTAASADCRPCRGMALCQHASTQSQEHGSTPHRSSWAALAHV